MPRDWYRLLAGESRLLSFAAAYLPGVNVTSRPTTSAASSEPSPRLITGGFAFICGAQFLNYASNLMVDPLLSLYLTSVGYSTTLVGVIISAFSIMSFTTRPFVGRGVDSWSPRGIYVLGGLALAIGSFSYAFPILGLLIITRMIHGLGWGCINTAGPALATESAPPGR